MKYILVIPDGAADNPIAERGGKTVLELADTPALDRLAREGRLGLAQTVPAGMKPGSDVANLSLLGYDPRVGFTGRAALEAAAANVPVPEGDAVFRANLVTVVDGTMVDYSAGHISTDEGRELIEGLDRDAGLAGVRFFPGVGYRHLCLIQGGAGAIPECTAPHDIVGEAVERYQPKGGLSARVLEVEQTSGTLLPGYAPNLKRTAQGKRPATQVWLWGGATAMALAAFTSRFGLGSAGLISAVDLMRGIGTLAGMDILDVPGATAYLDTNYAGKGTAALEYLRDHDFVAVHVEAPDEAGHNGDLAGKIRSIEDIDRHILAPLSEAAREHGDWRIMVAPDHPTPVATGKHSADPVPVLLWGPGFTGNGAAGFTEREAAEHGEAVAIGWELMAALTGEGEDKAFPGSHHSRA